MRIPIGQLDYMGAVIFGVGLGCNFTAAFASDWEPGKLITLGFAVMFAGAVLRSIDWFRRKQISTRFFHLAASRLAENQAGAGTGKI